MTQQGIKKLAFAAAIIFVVICGIAVVLKLSASDTTSTEASEVLEEQENSEETDEEATEESFSASQEIEDETLSDLQKESDLLASLSWFDATHDWRELDLPTITSTLRAYSWFNADTQTLITIRYFRIDDDDLVNDYTDLYAYSVAEAWLDRDLGIMVASLYINDYETSASVDLEIAELITVTISPAINDEANTSSSPLRLDVEFSGNLKFAASTYYAIERTS